MIVLIYSYHKNMLIKNTIHNKTIFRIFFFKSIEKISYLCYDNAILKIIRVFRINIKKYLILLCDKILYEIHKTQ